MGIGDELGSVFKFAQQGIMQARKTEYPALPHILCRMQKVGRMFRKIGISGLHESFRFGRVGLTDNHCSNTKHVGLALIDGAIIGTGRDLDAAANQLRFGFAGVSHSYSATPSRTMNGSS